MKDEEQHGSCYHIILVHKALISFFNFTEELTMEQDIGTDCHIPDLYYPSKHRKKVKML